jgi:hypothetical protein
LNLKRHVLKQLLHSQESWIAERNEDWENNLPEYIKLAIYQRLVEFVLRLSKRKRQKYFLENS